MISGQTTPVDEPCHLNDKVVVDAVPEDESPFKHESPLEMKLGEYSCTFVTNIPLSSNSNDASNPRTYFDLGLKHFFSYHHEEAYKCFLACLVLAPDCAFAHGMVALCHCPNYNFKGDPYYQSTDHPEEERAILAEAEVHGREDISIMRRLYPSQQVAAKHALLAIEKVEELKKRQVPRENRGSITEAKMAPCSQMISDVETQILSAIRTLTCRPGIYPQLAEETVGRPYADALRKIHMRFPDDAEVSCFFAESLMVLNAWKLYEYPTGRPLSRDVEEIQTILEEALTLHPKHAGICHLYVHLCEMSIHPEKALPACEALRAKLVPWILINFTPRKCRIQTHLVTSSFLFLSFADAGHLIHMPTHIDVLLGDYESCVEYNYSAILADEKMMRISPDTAGLESFYFGYIVHNFHMLVYGAILGGFESIAMEKARELNAYLHEDLFVGNHDLAAYLESYAALDIHIMVRFGRWKDILAIPFPRYPLLMLCRSASLHYARGLALTNTGEIQMAITEANLLDDLRLNPGAGTHILHNNQVSELLAVDAPMLRGEIAYFSGRYDEAFNLLRKAVAQQDDLNYDEPWGKMQPIRHSLGGLLCDQGHFEEAEQVFREDLKLHPRNPWALVGLIDCLNGHLNAEQGDCCSIKKDYSQDERTIIEQEREHILMEVQKLTDLLAEQRKSKWADYDISVPCLCCTERVNKKESAAPLALPTDML